MQSMIILAILAAVCVSTSAWMGGRVSRSSLRMGGGRSPAEKSQGKGGRMQSNKIMFKELRDKVNTAAEQPGFFESAQGQPVRILGGRTKWCK